MPDLRRVVGGLVAGITQKQQLSVLANTSKSSKAEIAIEVELDPARAAPHLVDPREQRGESVCSHFPHHPSQIAQDNPGGLAQVRRGGNQIGKADDLIFQAGIVIFRVIEDVDANACHGQSGSELIHQQASQLAVIHQHIIGPTDAEAPQSD